MNVIKRELRAHLKALIIWSICIFIMIMLSMSEFSVYYNNPELAAILDTMPKAMLKAFSINSANLTTVSGYVSILSIYFYIMLGIHAVLLGSSIISKEERDKTAEFLYTLPTSRQKIITGKLVAAVINCLILLGVTCLAVIVAILKYEPGETFFAFLKLNMLSIFFIQMIFLSIGMLMASIIKRYKKSGSISVSILLGTYILSVGISFSDKIEFMKYITPFKYFEPLYLLNENKMEGVYIIISSILILICLIGTFYFYPRRDLRI
ncbi:MAG: ABC transporter permease subunit [Spirochaetales bacterium]|jgi:ABC-2 type transport system permease protein|nr:ABC transporter permease subunit [Spirochaetales bacterium]